MNEETKSEARQIIHICKSAMACIVGGCYTFLEEQQALSRVSEQDIRRVLREYNPEELPVMPPDSYFEESAYIGEYRGCAAISKKGGSLPLHPLSSGFAQQMNIIQTISGKFLTFCAILHFHWKMRLWDFLKQEKTTDAVSYDRT